MLLSVGECNLPQRKPWTSENGTGQKEADVMLFSFKCSGEGSVSV